MLSCVNQIISLWIEWKYGSHKDSDKTGLKAEKGEVTESLYEKHTYYFNSVKNTQKTDAVGREITLSPKMFTF